MKKIIIILALWGLGVLRLAASTADTLVVDEERLSEYIHLLQGERVGVLTNHTAVVDGIHVVDTLLKRGVEIKRIFAPAKGYCGEGTKRHRDSYLGIEIISIESKPKANDVFGCDIILSDIQSVGVRGASEMVAFVGMMQVCGDIGVPLLILDRPNPLGGSVDGAIIESQLRSEGELPLPLLYGMTLGELARMINGEGWLAGGVKCPLTVVPCLNYSKCSDNTIELLSRGLCVEVPIVEDGKVTLARVVSAYVAHANKEEFFVNDEFDKLMGVGYIRKMIELGYTAEEIEGVWRGEGESFVVQRKPYLIYEY